MTEISSCSLLVEKFWRENPFVISNNDCKVINITSSFLRVPTAADKQSYRFYSYYTGRDVHGKANIYFRNVPLSILYRSARRRVLIQTTPIRGIEFYLRYKSHSMPEPKATACVAVFTSSLSIRDGKDRDWYQPFTYCIGILLRIAYLTRTGSKGWSPSNTHCSYNCQIRR